MYHTTSRILVNGPQEHLFESEHLPQIRQEGEKIVGLETSVLNTQLRGTLSDCVNANSKISRSSGDQPELVPIGGAEQATNFHEESVVIGDDTSDIEASEIRSDCSDYVGDLTLSGMEIDFDSDTGASHDLNITVIENKDMRITKSIPDESVTSPDSVSDIHVNSDRDLHKVHAIDAELVKILDNIAFVAEKMNTVQTNNISSELTNKIQTLIEKISTDRDESSEQFRSLAKKVNIVIKHMEQPNKNPRQDNIEKAMKNMEETMMKMINLQSEMKDAIIEGNRTDVNKLMARIDGIDNSVSVMDNKLDMTSQINGETRNVNVTNNQIDELMKKMTGLEDKIKDITMAKAQVEVNKSSITRYHLVQGPKDPLSNFYKTRLEHVIGDRSVVFTSSEQCFQYRKTLFLTEGRDTDMLRSIMQAKTAAEAKWLGDKLNDHPNITAWRNIACNVMRSILKDKARCSTKFREKLQEYSKSNTALYHSVSDPFWGIGLDTEEIVHPLQSADIRGRNMHGVMLTELMPASQSPAPAPRKTPWGTAVVTPVPAREERPVAKVLLIGNSLTTHIREKALGQDKMNITKIPAQHISAAREAIMNYSGPEPQCVVIQVITNEAKDTAHSGKLVTQHCLEGFDGCLDIINDKWPLCKPIVGLAPPRGDSDRNANVQTAINGQLRLNLNERSVDYMDLDDFGYNLYPNNKLYSDHIHFNQSGVSRYASRLKKHLHTVLGL